MVITSLPFFENVFKKKCRISEEYENSKQNAFAMKQCIEMQWVHKPNIYIHSTKLTFNYDCNGNNHWESQCKTEEFIVHSCRNKRVICLNLFNSWFIVVPAACRSRKKETWIVSQKKRTNGKGNQTPECDQCTWFLWYCWEMNAECPFPGTLSGVFSFLFSFFAQAYAQKIRFNSLAKGNEFPLNTNIDNSNSELKCHCNGDLAIKIAKLF